MKKEVQELTLDRNNLMKDLSTAEQSLKATEENTNAALKSVADLEAEKTVLRTELEASRSQFQALYDGFVYVLSLIR